MKRALILFGLLLHASIVYCQKIQYQKSFATALEKAKAEKKLVLLIITSPIKINHTTFPQISNTAIYSSGFDNTDVVNLYNKDFVNYTVAYNDSLSFPLLRKYPNSSFPVYLFIDSKSNLVYKKTGNSTLASVYTDLAKKVLDIASSGKTLSDYEVKYNKGDVSAAFLKEYITLREDLGFFNNAKLIDDYADQLTIKSFENYNEILFILKAGPFAFGKAYNLCTTNRRLFDSVYKKEPVDLRTEINKRIISNTITEAITKKNVVLAQQCANFTGNTWNNNYKQAAIASQGKMLYYYSSIKDTASYYRQATFYYDNYYMNISADSSRKLDKVYLEELLEKPMKVIRAADTMKYIIKGKDSIKITQRTTKSTQYTSGIYSGVAYILNSAAYQFYSSGTRNQNYLSKALLWAKRAIELEKKSSFYDTEAHLLYRLGFYDEAQSAEIKAIELDKGKSKESSERYKVELNKIKSHQL